jgi:prepilin-type N-terminal cleavage/methylation domain-containing protein
MKTKQQGFTLIELVVVIVLLGIIGAVATARFQDLSAGAADAAEQGVAAELSSASAINYAASRLPSGAAVAITGTVDCTADVLPLLQSGALPANITLADSGAMACGGVAGTVVQCTVTHASGTATNATATIICTG